MSLDSTYWYGQIEQAKNMQLDTSNFVTFENFKKAITYFKDKSLETEQEINQLKEMMQEIIKENKELKQEIQKLKAEKSDKDYFSLDL